MREIERLKNLIGQCRNMIAAGYYVHSAERDMKEALDRLNILEWEEAYRMEGIR